MPSRPPDRPARSNRPTTLGAVRAWRARGDRPVRLLKTGALVVGVPAAVMLLVASVFWVIYGHMIDRRLGGEQRPVPRIFGRPFELRPGQGLSPLQLEQRLNDVGYAQRAKAELPGEFTNAGN